jgi:hypothetical protein
MTNIISPATVKRRIETASGFKYCRIDFISGTFKAQILTQTSNKKSAKVKPCTEACGMPSFFAGTSVVEIELAKENIAFP